MLTRNFLIVCLTMFLLTTLGFAQKSNNQSIAKASIKGDTLQITFTNKSKRKILVLELKYRVGADLMTLNNKFYKYTIDTLHILLTKEVDKEFVSINKSHNSPNQEGRLLYNDKLLKPRKKYCTEIKLPSIANTTIRVITLQLDDNRWTCIVDKQR